MFDFDSSHPSNSSGIVKCKEMSIILFLVVFSSQRYTLSWIYGHQKYGLIGYMVNTHTYSYGRDILLLNHSVIWAYQLYVPVSLDKTVDRLFGMECTNKKQKWGIFIKESYTIFGWLFLYTLPTLPALSPFYIFLRKGSIS